MNHSLVFAILIVLLYNFSETVGQDQIQCPYAFYCSQEEDLVWVTDGSTCEIFTNQCIFNSSICFRLYENTLMDIKKEYKEISKKECQQLCNYECPKNNVQVCGFYKNQFRTFANVCEMNKHNCINGEQNTLISLIPCLPHHLGLKSFDLA